MVLPGPDKLAAVNDTVTIRGTVTDDGNPLGGRLTSYWTIVGGPVPLTPENPSQLETKVRFDQPGVYVARLTASDSELTGVAEATITVTSPGEHAFESARSTRGTEFWLAFPGIGYHLVPSPTPIDRGPPRGDRIRNPQPGTLTPITDAVPALSVIIAAEDGANGTVQVPGLSSLQSFSIAPGSTKRISIPAGAMISADDYVENKGVFVQSDRPVTVFALARRDLISQTDPRFPDLALSQPRYADSAAAYLVYPVPSLGLFSVSRGARHVLWLRIYSRGDRR